MNFNCSFNFGDYSPYEEQTDLNVNKLETPQFKSQFVSFLTAALLSYIYIYIYIQSIQIHCILYSLNFLCRTFPVHDSHSIISIRLACWKKEVDAVRDWYQNVQRNWVGLDGERSKWMVWNSALEVGRKSVSQIQTYLFRISEGTTNFFNFTVQLQQSDYRLTAFHNEMNVFGTFNPDMFNKHAIQFKALACICTMTSKYCCFYQALTSVNGNLTPK